jgi:prepilin-type N-terminal cleavage/methylation domain-containing protein
MRTADQRPLRRQQSRRVASTRHFGFTLVELLVVMVILSILGSLSLAGLNVGRQRSKRDRTNSTISKINDVIQEMYDSYASRAIDDALLPQLMTYEMPDQWVDVRAESEWPTLPASLKTGPIRRYARMAQTPAQRATYSNDLANAECLWLCVARSGFQPDALEQFRPDELTDLDKDGAKEFADGWGKPIFFLRWAPGFVEPLSPIQTQTDLAAALAAVPGSSGTAPKSWRTVVERLTPLIYSAGPDEASNDTLNGPDGYGIQRPGSARSSPYSPFQFGTVGAPRTDSSTPDAYRDNITNHDIMAR